MEEFFINLKSIEDKLPVIQQEIGDTWINGISSDPRKIAEYRAVSRILGQCYQQGE
jgi:hypothetical protein